MTGSLRQKFSAERAAHWDDLARENRRRGFFSGGYHDRLATLYRSRIMEGSSVLEIGCAGGGLLAGLNPSEGVGIDISAEMIRKASSRHPGLDFRVLDAHDAAELNRKFDYIVLSDLVNDVHDVQCVLQQVSALSHDSTRIVLNFHSQLWAPVLGLARRLGLANRTLRQNWLAKADLANLFTLTGLELISSSEEIVLPARLGPVGNFINRLIPKIWPLSHLALTHLWVARPRPRADMADYRPGVSIIVAARNEQGHIQRLIDEIPVMGTDTEVIFVEGGSSDDTWGEIERNLDRRPDLDISLHRQPGTGKADAVRLGFERAVNDVLMILDADHSVAPGDLVRFYDALIDGQGEFINGVRLVYPMEDEAMRFLNMIGNKFFTYGFRFALGQPIKDTLCGTKVLSMKNYRRIEANRAYFGEFDPYGDFDLIFGAARLNLKIIDMPIRYLAREYGETNINRWSGGLLLFRMLLIGLAKLRFV